MKLINQSKSIIKSENQLFRTLVTVLDLFLVEVFIVEFVEKLNGRSHGKVTGCVCVDGRLCRGRKIISRSISQKNTCIDLEMTNALLSSRSAVVCAYI